MKVELVQSTANPIPFMANIASICYGHEEAKSPLKLVQNLNKLGHHSVFEHVYFTFKISGISRACLLQLTRHRHASYTVRSQRYCDESSEEYIIPNAIEENKQALEYYNTAIDSIYLAYDELIELGIKREDARSILPNATSTDLYMSMDLRELIHIYKLRTHQSAQEEIRELLYDMVTEVILVTPELKFLFKGEI